MKNSLIALVLALIFLIGACGAAQTKKNRQNMLKLNIGMNREEVLQTMGPPFKTESYRKNGDIQDFWFYYTKNCTNADSCFTPLLLVNDELKGWGRNYYDDTIRLKQDIKIKQDIKKDVKIHTE